LLVPPGNPEALADALGLLVRDAALRNSMGEAGRRRAESVFGLDVMLREYERLYLSLGNRSRDMAIAAARRIF
jgi:glycosyltransferase involved in cell wall biosynthesis